MTNPKSDSIEKQNPVIARVCGLPISQLRPLHLQDSLNLINHITELEQWLESKAAELVLRLEKVIGQLPEGETRFTLILLRRSLHKRKLPKGLNLDLLPTEYEDVHTWISSFNELQKLKAKGEMVLEQEIQDRRGILKDLSRQDIFLHGLVTTNPSFFESLTDWHKGKKLTAKAERKLSLYLARAAAKTSPLSTFTSLNFTSSQRSQTPEVNTEDDFLSLVEPSRSIITEILSVIATWPEIRQKMPIRLNSSTTEHLERLDFLGWKGGEVIKSVPRTKALDLVLSALSKNMCYGDLLKHLTTEHPHIASADWQTFVEKLLKVSLLQLMSPVAEQAPNYLQAWLMWLEPFQEERVQTLRHKLNTFSEQINTYTASFNHTEQRVHREGILDAVQALYTWTPLKQHNIRPPRRNAFFEDINRHHWHLEQPALSPQALKDLSLVQSLVGLFDPRLAAKAHAQTAFESLQHDSIPLLDFYKHIHEDFTSATELRSFGLLNKRAPASLNPLRQKQKAVLNLLESKENQAFLALDANMLKEILIDVPKPRSLAYYTQTMQDKLVINAVQAGYGRTQARLSGLLERLEQQHRQTAQNIDTQTVFADLAGVFRSNINLRKTTAAYEILYPGYTSNRPLEEQILLADLYVRQSYDGLQLFSHRLNKIVIPYHGGLMGEAWLPPLYRFMLLLFADGPVDPIAFSLHQLAGNMSKRRTIIRLPRLSVGNIILERQRWLVPQTLLPTRSKGQSRFQFYCDLTTWRQLNHIPDTCFVMFGGKHKPMYIDFRDPFALDLFEHLVQQSEERVFFTEMLPEPEEAHIKVGKQNSEPEYYVSEYVFELNTWQHPHLEIP